ncbi:hypothetical protein [Fodinicola feengrottensis]|uniref:hypothetical protein n=1 Tax=Fodinicola feengrottensis TaxID=435914 RepID=UPI0013D2B541|nr:hypothetical protein [Fodinicola feengrottensis]
MALELALAKPNPVAGQAVQTLANQLEQAGQAIGQQIAAAPPARFPNGASSNQSGGPAANAASTSPGGQQGGAQQDAGQQGGAQQGGAQQGGAQQGGAQQGGDQQAQGGDQQGQDPSAGGGMPTTDDPSLQGDTSTPTLPPPTITPPNPVPLPNNPTTLPPFMPLGGLGKGLGGGGGPIGGGGGGVGGGGGGPKNIAVAASPFKATTAPTVGSAPTLSQSGTGGLSSPTTGVGSAGGIPPMMPMQGGGGAGGGLKSGNGPRAITGRGPKPTSRVPGLPRSLQGKAGSVDRNAFPAPAKPTRRQRAEDVPTLQLLDEEMWQVDETPGGRQRSRAGAGPPGDLLIFSR